MRSIPQRLPLRRTLLALTLAAGAAGCAGGRDDLLRANPAQSSVPPLGSGASDASAGNGPVLPGLLATSHEVADLAAALDRFNLNQSAIQTALADQQRSAVAQADVARQNSDELMSARHMVMVFAIAASAATLVSLLLAVVVVRQTGQVRRAARALAAAKAELLTSQAALDNTAGDGASRDARGGPVTAAGGGAAGGAAGGGAPGVAPAARLRKRPPVG